MGENAAVAAGTAAAAVAASVLLKLFLLGLDGGHLRLAVAAADRLLNRHHLASKTQKLSQKVSDGKR